MTNKIQNYTSLLIAVCSIFFTSLIVNILIKTGASFDYMAFSLRDIYMGMSVSVLPAFVFILLRRLKQVVIIILFMRLFKPESVYNLLILLLSVFYGFMMSVQTYSGGIREVGVFLISIFPHYLIYLFALNFIYRYYIGRVLNKNRIKFITILLIIIIIGVIFEENFLRFFLR